jgi:protein arginine N-methyltransferase 1
VRLQDVHAFLAWFDIAFQCTHKQVKFSTGPHSRYTHWKCVRVLVLFKINSLQWFFSYRQTVFYTPSTLTVTQGDNIVGRLSCAPNRRNNRDLDITCAYKLEHAEEETSVHYKMCVVLYFHPRVLHILSLFFLCIR